MERNISKQADGRVVAVSNASSTELLPERDTRRRALVTNRDAANAVYVTGDESATTSMFQLKAGESMEIFTADRVNAIADTASVNVHVWEEFD